MGEPEKQRDFVQAPAEALLAASADETKPENTSPSSRSTGKPVTAFMHHLTPHTVAYSLEPRREERCDALQNRQRILQAAQSLFAERGVEAVTMTEIAQAAGVGKGTLYRRFPHKGSLCQALMDTNTRAFQSEVISGGEAPGRAGRPLARLNHFLERLVSFTEANGELLTASFEAEVAQGTVARYNHPVYDWKRMTMVIYLRACIASGACRPDLDVDYLADALLAPLEVDLYLYQRQIRGLGPERIAAGLRQLLQGIMSQHG